MTRIIADKYFEDSLEKNGISKDYFYPTEVKKFIDSEILVKLDWLYSDHFHCSDLMIIIKTLVRTETSSVNDKFMELLQTIDIAIRKGETNIVLIIPYMCYLRQDRESI